MRTSRYSFLLFLLVLFICVPGHSFFNMTMMRKKSVSTFSFTISTNQVNPNLATLATSAGWNGTDKVQATINAGVTIAALSITQSFPGGLRVINNGTIAGYRGLSDAAGGTALYVRVNVEFQNNGSILGGGGGGGSGNSGFHMDDVDVFYGYGGSGGSGQGLISGTTTVAAATSGSAGSSVCAGNSPWYGCTYGGNGGSGGAWGAPGTTGGASSSNAPASGTGTGAAGGAAGKSVDGNSYISWLATGTRTGPII